MVRQIDLTGKEFANLKVLYRVKNNVDSGKKRSRWHCMCNCGNEFDVLQDNLKRRPNMSCNECANKNRAIHNRTNVIGQKFGRLTILDILWNYDRAKAICKCDCGNDYIGIKSDIVTGHTKSCGCLQSENTSAANTKDWTGHISCYGIEFLFQDKMNEKGQWLWKCKCGLCNNLFSALPAKVNNGHITSCGCRVQSSGEEYIEKILKDMNVEFEPQYKFEDCKLKYVLRFDFAILNNGKLLGLIEYDGKQHFEPIEFFGGEKGFLNTQERDKIKNTYCELNNIPLIRLPYTLTEDEIKTKIYEYYLSVTTAGCA